MKNTIWSQIESDDKAAANLASGMGISPVLANLLVQRNVKTKSEAIKFLNPSIKNICNPFKLKDMAKAVSRIEKAISNDEKIFIYGDYDVDGITSSATLVNGLRKIGANVDYFIPSRDEGYGLNSDAIEKISTKSKLIITVDCGISSFDEIECAKELGVDIIVTDHHEIKDIPKAFAVINPKREDNAYKFKNLAGVGTAFMLLYAIYKSLNQDLDFLFSLLDLVAIGTISDVVPLISENRIFVKHGLNIIKRSQNVGIQTINDNLFPEKEITSMDVGFKIAPLFNAAGRLEHAGQVVEFLTTKDRSRAQKIFDYLVQLNLKRKEIGKDMLENADKKASDQDSVIIVYSTEFHQGLVGIIAARLVDKYNVPAIVLKVKEDGTATGSARSIEGFNIVSAFQKCEDILIKFGGHSKAAGLTIDSTKLPEFAGRIKEIFSNEVKDNKKEIKISSSLQDFSVSIDLCQSVNRLRPFGYGNPEPLFLLEDVSLVNVKKIGKNGDHLMFDLIGRNRIKNAVWFKNSELIHKIETGKKYDIVFKIEENFFNGRISPKVYAEDIKENRRKKCSIKYYRDLHGVKLPLNASFTSTFPIREGTEIKDSESYFFFEGIRVNLNDELQHLLRELQQNYFFKFKLKVTKSEQRDEYYINKISIDRRFDITSDNSKDSLNRIKEMLIGKFQYNSIQKQVLRKIVLENKSVNLISKRGRGIKTIATTVAMYLYKKTGKKSLLISKNEIEEPMNRFFDKNIDNPPFTFVDNIDKKVQGLYLRFFDKDIEAENKIVDIIREAPNIEIVPKKTEGIVFNRSMKIDHKKRIIAKIKKGEKVLAERDILALF